MKAEERRIFTKTFTAFFYFSYCRCSKAKTLKNATKEQGPMH